MSDPDPLDQIKTGTQIVGQIIQAAAGSEEAKVAAENLGKSAVTITATINNVLLPLAALNFAVEKARAYFANKFPNDLQDKASTIPAERLTEPSAMIAAPILQSLAFAHEEPLLKNLYLTLLVTAMDREHRMDAHPAFVETIRQLSPEDADLVRGSLFGGGVTPIAQLETTVGGSGSRYVYHRNLLNLRDDSSQRLPIENDRLPMMVDNWQRLGLVTVDYARVVASPGSYDWLESRPEVARLRKWVADHDPSCEVHFRKGILERTDFGKAFALAVGISPV